MVLTELDLLRKQFIDMQTTLISIKDRTLVHHCPSSSQESLPLSRASTGEPPHIPKTNTSKSRHSQTSGVDLPFPASSRPTDTPVPRTLSSSYSNAPPFPRKNGVFPAGPVRHLPSNQHQPRSSLPASNPSKSGPPLL